MALTPNGIWYPDTAAGESWYPAEASAKTLADSIDATLGRPNSGERIATTIRTTNVTAFTAETVISSVTADLVAGKTYRVRWVAEVSASDATTTARLRIREDNLAGTQLQLRNVAPAPFTGTNVDSTLEVEFTAVTSGSKTFAGTMQRLSGSGLVSSAAAPNQPQYLYVDYIRG